MYQKILLLITYTVTTKLIGYIVLSGLSPTERRPTRVRENVNINWGCQSKIAKFCVRTLVTLKSKDFVKFIHYLL